MIKYRMVLKAPLTLVSYNAMLVQSVVISSSLSKDSLWDMTLVWHYQIISFPKATMDTSPLNLLKFTSYTVVFFLPVMMMHFTSNSGAWHVIAPLLIKAGGSQWGPRPWLQPFAHWSNTSQSSSEATKYPAWWPLYKLCLSKFLPPESQASLWWPVERSRKSCTYSRTN